MDAIAAAKATLRQAMKDSLRDIPAARREAESERIRQWLVRQLGGATVLAYAPLPEEVDIWPILARLAPTGRLVLPRVEGESLTLHRVANLDALRAGPLRLRQPAEGSTLVDPEVLDVALVPGLAFTRAGARLGRGKGMFDRCLARFPPTVRLIGVAFPEQILPEIPMGDHDVAVHEVVPSG